MPRKCCVLACRFSHLNNVSFSTFNFPSKSKFPTTFEKWLKFSQIRENEITKSSAICSGHFLPICFNFNSIRKTLKSGSIPTVYYLGENKNNSLCFTNDNVNESHPQSKIVSFLEIKTYCLKNVPLN